MLISNSGFNNVSLLSVWTPRFPYVFSDDDGDKSGDSVTGGANGEGDCAGAVVSVASDD